MADASPTASAILGTLDLNGGRLPGDDFWFEVLAEGFEPGSPEAVRRTNASLLLDGDDDEVLRHGNRQRGMRVQVGGVDQESLDNAERVLALACKGPTTLAFQMPESTNVSVWDVLHVSMAESFDDLAQVQQKTRIYTLTLVCLPWPHPPEKTTLTIQTYLDASMATLDDGTDEGNWTLVEGSPFNVDTTTFEGETAIRYWVSPDQPVGIRWDGSVGSGANYLWIDVTTENQNQRPVDVLFSTGSTPLTLGATPVMVIPNGAFTRQYFAYGGSGAPHFLLATSGISLPSTRFLNANFGKTDKLPPTGLVSVDVGGSQRTVGSIKIEPTIAELANQVFVYADPTMQSYGWVPNAPDTWAFAPAGRYMAYLYILGTGPDPGEVYTVQAVSANGGSQVARTRLGDTYPVYVPVGELALGGQRDGRVGAITVTATHDGAPITTPKVLLFRVADDTALTYIDPVTDDSTALYIDPPTLNQPHGGVFLDSADGTGLDALPLAVSWQTPVLTPPLTPLFIAQQPFDVAPSALTISIEYYELSHTYVARSS